MRTASDLNHLRYISDQPEVTFIFVHLPCGFNSINLVLFNIIGSGGQRNMELLINDLHL